MVINTNRVKTLVTFVHFDREGTHLYKENLNFFLEVGLFASSDVQFNFVINSETGGEQIPQTDNTRVIKGHNKGYDFGAYKQSIDSVNYSDFDYFIFINDTCRGPFLPSYIPRSCTWIDLFLSPLDDKVKITGPTWWSRETDKSSLTGKVPEGQRTHIQSFCLGVDKIGLKCMVGDNIFSLTNPNQSMGRKWNIVTLQEVGASQSIIKRGFKAKPFQLSHLMGTQHCDIHKEGRYFGMTPHPLEMMFIKTNRINDRAIKTYTKWLLNKTNK